MVAHTCEHCGKFFTRSWDYNRHQAMHKRKRKQPTAPVFTKKRKLDKPPASRDFKTQLIHRGFGDLFKIYRASFNKVYNDVTVAATMLCTHLCYLLERAVLEKDGVKAHVRCTVKFYKAVDPETVMPYYFVSKPTIYLHTSDFEGQYKTAMANIHKQIQDFTRRGSGWVMERIEHVDLYISRYRPIRGNTYTKLPTYLAKKKAIVNIQNKDNQCFKWSVLAALYPAETNPQRPAKYTPYANELDFTDITFPVALSDIPTFEKRNNLAINVLGYGDDGLFPIQSTHIRDKTVRVINLLLLTPNDGPSHYCLIKDINRLLFTSTAHHGQKYICDYCLCPFNTAERLDRHQEFCTVDRQRVEMPKELELKFKNVHKQLRAPYVMYADCESFPRDQGDGKKKHIPNSYGVLGVRRCCQDRPEFEPPAIYRGPEPIRHFLETVLAKGENYVRSANAPLNMTPDEETLFQKTKSCYLCLRTLGEDRCRDHCHVCGVFRGAVHQKCNLTAKTNKDVTVLFHNLRKYDGHLVMQEIGTLLQDRNLKLECVAKGMEDYMSFVVRLKTDNVSWRLRFVDSLAFLPASLATLVKNLPKDKLIALRKFTKHPDLLSQKGSYPYDRVTDPRDFEYPGLFPIQDFHNSLTKEPLSEKGYAHANHVFAIHDFIIFGEYHDLYLLTDILLLADVFENFRDFALDNYGLDPVHYITLPSFSWDALLKFTKVQLELLDDPDMYQFFSAGIRGGISTITHRYAKANNPYLPDYNPSEPNSYIMYLDANNLYGYAMKQQLPVGGFEWVGELDDIPDDGYGYVLEVDLDYPPELHQSHNDYPLAPEPMVPPYLSKYCAELKDKLNIADVDCEKLIPNLMDKKHYIIHHKNLRQCLDLGLKLKKIHRGIRFKEGAWMAPYIDFNTERRRNAKNAFEKDLFKLLNNAVFGKSMENVFNYITVKLTADAKQYEKLVANPLYKESRHFDNDLHAVLMKRESVTLCKPIYTGFSILELSKTLMYDFHYNYMVKNYGEKAKLLFTDTDSLCYSVQTTDIYQDMLKNRDEQFDTSDYPIDHELYSDLNKKLIGYMKDETSGTPIQEFVGLRSKMYSLLLPDSEKKRAKGINRAVVQKDITHDDYKKTLFGDTQMKHKIIQFRNSAHHIYTVEGSKTSLSAFDDKRYVLGDGYTTLAYGHRDIDSTANRAMPSSTILYE